MRSIYLIGSLRNPEVPKLAKELRDQGFEVFDDWYAAGPEADDKWQQYEKDRGHDFATALNGHAAKHVFEYDRTHLDRCDIVVMLGPCGKSGHLEVGYAIGRGKPAFMLLDKEPERFDVMYRFATAVCTSKQDLINKLKNYVMDWLDEHTLHGDTAFINTYSIWRNAQRQAFKPFRNTPAENQNLKRS